jgi:hypothetical protein
MCVNRLTVTFRHAFKAKAIGRGYPVVLLPYARPARSVSWYAVQSS